MEGCERAQYGQLRQEFILNPINSNTVLAFLQWLSASRPHIRTLTSVGEFEFLRLANAFEDGKVDAIPALRQKWAATYRVLSDDRYEPRGYDEVRRTMNRLGVRYSLEAPLRDDTMTRYRDVPLRAVFLYSTEDVRLLAYIKEHWASLSSMSGQYCDVYASLNQIAGQENVYDLIDALTEQLRRTTAPLRPLSGISKMDLSTLPGLYFWDDVDYIFFPLASTGEDELREEFRELFAAIRRRPELNTIALLIRDGRGRIPE
jgi:hypothetical protein